VVGYLWGSWLLQRCNFWLSLSHGALVISLSHVKHQSEALMMMGALYSDKARTSRLPCMQFCSIFMRGSKINGRASSVQSELLCSVCVQCRQASLTPSIQESEIPLDNSTSQSVHSSSQQNYSTGRYNYRTSQYILHLHL